MYTKQEIINAARALSNEDRATIIHALWVTISPNEWQDPSETWLKEIADRSDAIDQGKMTSAPWNEVRLRTSRKVGLSG